MCPVVAFCDGVHSLTREAPLMRDGSYTYLASAVTPCYILIHEDLELEISDEREYVTFAFLGLSYFTQKIFYIYPF